MAKKPDVTTIASGYYSRQALNNNFTALRDAFDNTLSRDGSTPNVMAADLDLNNQDILNVKNTYTTNLILGGVDFNASVAASLAAAASSADDSAASAVASDLSATGASLSATGASLSAAQAALYDGVWSEDVSSLLADTIITYTVGQPSSVVTGDYVLTRKEGFSYEVAASGATDQHVTTAGGVKLYVLPGGDGYNILAFGADRSGAVSASTVIQAALSNLKVVGGGVLYFPRGSYLVGANVLQTNLSCTIQGEGPEVTKLLCNGTGISINNSTAGIGLSVVVRDMSFISQTAGTGNALTVVGTSVRTLNRAQFSASGLVFRGQDDDTAFDRCLNLSQVSDSKISNVALVGARNSWAFMSRAISVSTSVDVVIDSIRAYWGSSGVYSAGDTEGLTLSNSHLVGFEIGFEHIATGGGAMQQIHNCHMNTNQFGVKMTDTDGIGSRQSNVSNNYLIHNVPSSSGIGGLTDYNWTGIQMNGDSSKASDNIIGGSLLMSDTGITMSGVCTQSSASTNNIVGCSNRAILFLAGANDGAAFGNVGISSGIVVTSALRTRIHGNSKEIWSDEYHGGATVIESASTVVVTHNLSGTPTLADIFVTPRNNMGLAAKFWVSAVTATTFTISLDRTPGSGATAQFSWLAKISKSNV